MPVAAAAFLWKPYKIIKDRLKWGTLPVCMLYWGLQVFFWFQTFYLLTITLTFIFCFTPGGFAWTLYGAHSHGLHFWVCLVRNVHEMVFWPCLFCSTLHKETDTGPVWCFSAALSSSFNTKPLCSYAYAIVVEDYLCHLTGLLVLSHTHSSDQNNSKNCFYSEAELYWLRQT